jgi:hypothetical protein
MLMDKAEASSAATAARVLADGVEEWLPLVRTEFQEFVGRFAAGERATIGARRVVGVLTPGAVDAMAVAGQRLARGTMAVEAQQLEQLLGVQAAGETGAVQAGRVELVSSLPDLLTRVGERWIDAEGRMVLLCSSDEPGRVARVLITAGQADNAITAVDLIRPQDFDSRGMRRVDGPSASAS